MKSDDAAYTGPERRINRIAIPPCERCGSSKPVVTARSAQTGRRTFRGSDDPQVVDHSKRGRSSANATAGVSPGARISTHRATVAPDTNAERA